MSQSSFIELAEVVPELLPHLTARGQLDFNDPAAVLALTQATLKRDHGLLLELPEGRLCPPVPARRAYVEWIIEVARATREGPQSREEEGLRAADIGTGASAIYALLGCAMDRKFRWKASEIDALSAEWAGRNLLLNGLQGRVEVVQPDEGGILKGVLPFNDANDQQADFTMCNPPFYSSDESILHSSSFKSQPPKGVFTGGEKEMITPGGEVSFVGQMIRESAELEESKGGARWYSSLSGFHSSLQPLIDTLHSTCALDGTTASANYTIRLLSPSPTSPTVRHILAWSFGPQRVPRRLVEPWLPAGPLGGAVRTWKETDVQLKEERLVEEALREAGVVFSRTGAEEQEEGHVEWLVEASNGESWTRAARRARKRAERMAMDKEEKVLECTLVLSPLPSSSSEPASEQPEQEATTKRYLLSGEWTYGRSLSAWEGLWRFVLARLKANPGFQTQTETQEGAAAVTEGVAGEKREGGGRQEQGGKRKRRRIGAGEKQVAAET